jgi:hypothetical protein
MSVTTQLQIRSLVRDSSGQLASQAGALRRAENVVLRAPGVAESRPNFTVLRERTVAQDKRVRALAEYGDVVIAIEEDIVTNIWTARDITNDVGIPRENGSTYEPPDYDASETKFALARGNLYLTSAQGILAVNGVVSRPAGVEVMTVTDYAQDSTSAAGSTLYVTDAASYAYRYVFVRKDSNGYERRSPPSHAIVQTRIPDTLDFSAGTRFYFPVFNQTKLTPGDRVEFYRTRTVAGTSPSGEFFLAFSYTITAADVLLEYFVPPTDNTSDDDLGAALYTNSSQGGAVAAKYPPPIAHTVAQFAGVMWFANTINKHRIASVVLRHLFRSGIVRSEPYDITSTSLVSATIDTTSTAGLEVGMYLAEDVEYGPSKAGTIFAANTYVVEIISALQFRVNQFPIAVAGPLVAYVMDHDPPQGLIADIISAGATFTALSAVVTGIADTTGYRAGMYITDKVAGSPRGPTVDGAKVRAGTYIQSVDSATQITMTQVALSSGALAASGGAIGDVVEVAGVEFYAWPFTVTMLQPWGIPATRCFNIGEPQDGTRAYQIAVSQLVTLINWQEFASTSGPDVAARPSGVITLGSGPTSYITTETLSSFALGLSLEERGFGGAAFTVDSSAPLAFSPTLPRTSENDEKPARVYFSDIDEPESVRLFSFFDVGSTAAPVLALAPLRDALLVFKSDGLWRVTGAAPDSWSVQCLDTQLRLLRPECVAVVNDVAFCWAEGGFFAIDGASVRSISAGALDVELRAAAQLVMDGDTCHGAWVAGWPERQLVLFGVPGVEDATATARIYAYSLITSAFSEWPLAWGCVAESATDNLYHAEPPQEDAPLLHVTYEVREAVSTAPRGYDRIHDLTINTYSGTELVVDVGFAGQWVPAVGDMVSALGSTAAVRTFRRITEFEIVGGADYVFTLEAAITGIGTLSAWKAYEVARCIVILEWHPASPAGIPSGAICRELQVQLDLRGWPNDEKLVSLPEYIVGGTSERDTTPHTITSSRARVAQVQPLRVGCSRQIARSASVAAYFKSGDIFALRVNGLSLVWEGTSERTRQ